MATTKIGIDRNDEYRAAASAVGAATTQDVEVTADNSLTREQPYLALSKLRDRVIESSFTWPAT